MTAVDYDGKPVQTKVHLQLMQRRWVNGKTETTPGPATDVTTDATGKAQASLPTQMSGTFELDASATTPENRVVTDSAWLWVMGGNEQSWYGADSRSVQIIADKKTYAPGDVAHLSILSQVANFHALVVATGNSVEFRKVLSSDGKTLTFDLPITGDAQPNLELSAVFLQDNQMYQATKQIKIPPVQRRLQVEITPVQQVFQPQQAALYDVVTRDYAGKPVSADLSFGVVDEAIYSIHPDSSGDIVRQLYPDRYVYASVDSSLQYYFSGQAGVKSPMLAERRAALIVHQMAQVKPGNDVVQPKVRKAFPDTAFTSSFGAYRCGRTCRRVSLTFPDSLTTWRATAACCDCGFEALASTR